MVVCLKRNSPDAELRRQIKTEKLKFQVQKVVQNWKKGTLSDAISVTMTPMGPVILALSSASGASVGCTACSCSPCMHYKTTHKDEGNKKDRRARESNKSPRPRRVTKY
eukprot:scpid24747/ scgid15228/ 